MVAHESQAAIVAGYLNGKRRAAVAAEVGYSEAWVRKTVCRLKD